VFLARIVNMCDDCNWQLLLGDVVTIVNVFHPLINLGTLAVSRRLMVDLLHQTGSAVTHSAPRFFLLYLGWSLLLAITGTLRVYQKHYSHYSSERHQVTELHFRVTVVA